MVSSTIELVRKYLESYTWKYGVLSEDKLTATFAGEQSEVHFNVVITVSEHWVGLTIWPYLIATRERQRVALATRLGTLNFYDAKLVRFAMTEHGETTVCLDVPVEALNEQLFHLSLDLVCYYADTYYAALIKLIDEIVS